MRVHLPLKQGLRRLIFSIHKYFLKVRVHLPLKQGLRPTHGGWCGMSRHRASASSIKTRIKTLVKICLLLLKKVRVHLPLKQGLRLF